VKFDTIIRNGTVIDGTGFPRFQADIGIADGRIVTVGKLTGAAAATEIDATGYIVAPGHVDSHTHYDAQIFWDPTCSNAGENGITTVVTGNCGFGFAPCKIEDRSRYMKMMETTEQVPEVQMIKGLKWSWETFPEFVEALKSIPKSINIMMFMPLTALMFYVMGEEAKSRRPNDVEMQRMKDLLASAMDAGACGLSLSFMGKVNNHVDVDGTPMPTDIMDPDDAYELSTVLRDRDEGIIQVISQIGPVGDRTISEGLARASNRPILHNVFSVSEFTPDLHRKSMDWLTAKNSEGLKIYAATVVTRAWNEVDLFRSPGCALDALDVYRELTFVAEPEEKRALLNDAGFRKRFNDAYDPVMFEATAGALDKYTVISLGDGVQDDDGIIGKTLRQVADDRSITEVDAFIDLALEYDLKVEFRTPGIAEDPAKVAELLGHSHVLAGASDGGAHTKNFSGGQWCTDLLLWLTAENEHYSLEEMHYRLAYQPARVMGLRDRGALLEGMAADILIYRLDDLFYDLERMDVIYDQPGGDFRRKARAGGYHKILVNGEVTFNGGDPDKGRAPGQYLSGLDFDHQQEAVAAE